MLLFAIFPPLSLSLSLSAWMLSADLVAAQVVSYDEFRADSGYTESAGGDGRLSAQSLFGPAGWQGSWSLPKSGASPLFLFREAAGLKYPAVSYPGGGGVEVTPEDGGTCHIGRRLAKGIPMKGNTAIYASFLLSVSGKKAQGSARILFSGVGGLGAGIQEGNLMVLARQDAGLSETGQQHLEWVPLLFQEYQANTTYLFVIKISDGGDAWGGPDDMEVWINPKDVSSEQAGSSNALVYNLDSPGNIAPPSGGITEVALRVENLQGITLRFDEFRLGTTWESVTGPIAP